MEAAGPTLPQRVVAVLHARQYVVFFAIGLHALSVAVFAFSAWLHEGGSAAKILLDSSGPLAQTVAARSLVLAAVFSAYIVAMTWLRAGYIRSLTGPLRLGAAGSRQFARLLGLELLLEAVAAVVYLAGPESVFGTLVALAALVFYLVAIYADYIVVLAGVGPLQALVLSWRTVRATLPLAALIVIVINMLAYASDYLLSNTAASSLLQATPMLLVRTIIMGSVGFVADVALVVLYLTTAESGRLERRSPIA